MTIPMEKLDEASRTLATTFAKQVAPKTGTDSVSGSSNLNRADKVEGVLLRISLGVKSSNASQEMPPFSAPVAVQENDLVEFEQLSTNVECFVGCLFGYVQHETMYSLVPEQRLAFNPRMAGVGIIICRSIRTVFRDLYFTRFQRLCFSSSRQHSLCSGSVSTIMSFLALVHAVSWKSALRRHD